MPFIRLVEKDEVPDSTRAVLETGEAKYGRLLYAWQAIAHNPAIFEAYLPFVVSIITPAALEQRIKELVAVRITLLNHCRYTLTHRLDSAHKREISEKDLSGLLDPPNHNFTEAEQVALSYAEELTTQVDDITYAENPQGVSSDTLQRLKQTFSDTEIAELTITIGLWNALTRIFRVMDFDLDMAAPPVEMDKAL